MSQVTSGDGARAGDYVWAYLRPEASDRGQQLEPLIGTLVRPGDHVLDVCCGFSPLSPSFLAAGCRVRGFDQSAEAIACCRERYAGGEYSVAADVDFETPAKVDVIVHLGIAPGEDPYGHESRTEVATALRVIVAKLPRVLLLETAVEWAAGYETEKRGVESLRIYRRVLEQNYQINLRENVRPPSDLRVLNRTVTVYCRDDDAMPGAAASYSYNIASVASLLMETAPAAQAASLPELNAGFGHLYYALGRILRARRAVVLGSRRGFSPISMAMALRDNANGARLTLVDAAYSDVEDGVARGMGGIGFWRDEAEVGSLLRRFGVEEVMNVEVALTQDFARRYRDQGREPLDLVLIDADHSFEGFGADFRAYADLLAPHGVILCHDTEVPKGYIGCPFGVMRYFREVVRPDPRFEAMSLPVWPGLGIVRKIAKVPVPVSDVPSIWVKVRRKLLQRLPMPESARQRLRRNFQRLRGR